MSRKATKAVTNICVVGSGNVGIAVAFQLQAQLKSSTKITVLSESSLDNSTSYSCGGFWEPYQLAGNPEQLTRLWGQYTYDYFVRLHSSEHAGAAGVTLIPSYNLFDESELPVQIPFWKDIVMGFHEMNIDDMRKLSLPSKYISGFQYTTVAVDQKYYIPWLVEQLKEKGVMFKTRCVSSLRAVAESDGGYDVVVNCTGLGSARLDPPDLEVYPVRGQVIRVKAPWMKCNWNFGPHYIIPNVDNVVLGGTAQANSWDTTISEEDSEDIMNGVCSVFPALRHAPVEKVWVGLRPCRKSGVRVECEKVVLLCDAVACANTEGSSSGATVMAGNGEEEDSLGAGRDDDIVFRTTNSSTSVSREVVIAHCYGHGGCGITLGMGSAYDLVHTHIIPLLN